MRLNHNNFTIPPFSWRHNAIMCGLYVEGHQSEWLSSFCCDLLIRKESAPWASSRIEHHAVLLQRAVQLCLSTSVPFRFISEGLLELLCLSSCPTALDTIKSYPTHPFGFLVTNLLRRVKTMKCENSERTRSHAHVEGAERCTFNRFCS